jgi:hypothetical protein
MTTHATAPRELQLVQATPQTVAPFGTLVGIDVRPDVDIPYYPGRVIEGGDIGFHYHGRAALRTAQVLPGGQPEVGWLERHIHLTRCLWPPAGTPTRPARPAISPGADHLTRQAARLKRSAVRLMWRTRGRHRRLYDSGEQRRA